MKYITGFTLIAMLSACGGGSRDYDSRQKTYNRSVGPISSACMASDRKARSSGLCNCIQAAANMKLTRAEQRRAVSFYKDPHQAQVVRQSDKRADELFWKTYTSYVDHARAMCS